MVGALFLDAGFEKTREILYGFFEAQVRERDWAIDFLSDYKTRLQELFQDRHKLVPSYSIVKEQGPDHARIFEVTIFYKFNQTS